MSFHWLVGKEKRQITLRKVVSTRSSTNIVPSRRLNPGSSQPLVRVAPRALTPRKKANHHSRIFPFSPLLDTVSDEYLFLVCSEVNPETLHHSLYQDRSGHPIYYDSQLKYSNVSDICSEQQLRSDTQPEMEHFYAQPETQPEAFEYNPNDEYQGWSFTNMEQDDLGWAMGYSETESCEYPSSTDEYATKDSSDYSTEYYSYESVFVPRRERDFAFQQRNSTGDCAAAVNHQESYPTEYGVSLSHHESPRAFSSTSSDRRRPRRLSKFSQRQKEREESGQYQASSAGALCQYRWM
jgi:hypothetical protein